MYTRTVLILLAIACKGMAQAPGGVTPQLKMWIRADQPGTITATAGKISAWRYLNDATKSFTASGTDQPDWQTNGINFQSSARFSGEHIMNGPAGVNAPIPAGDDDYSLFIVWKSSYTGDQGERLWMQWNCVTQKNGFSLDTYYNGNFFYGGQFEISPYNQGLKQPFTPGTWNISQLNLQNLATKDFEIIDQKNLTTTPLLLSSNGTSSNTARNILTNYQVLGAKCDKNDQGFHGDIAEVIIYDRPISGLERTKVFSYLALKYGVSLPGFNYQASDWNGTTGTIFWRSNATYNNDIFGIGRDESATGSLLNLPQSNSLNTGSGNGAGQTGKGNVILSASLDNGDYLMTAHNGQALTQTTAGLPSALAGTKRLARKWLVQNTGDVDAMGLTFDINGLTLSGDLTNPLNFVIVVDLDGDGDFTTGRLRYFPANTITGSQVFFPNIFFPNGVVFTITTQFPIQLLSKPEPPVARPGPSAGEQVYPNPFRNETHLKLVLSGRQKVACRLFNANGCLMREWGLEGRNGNNAFVLEQPGNLPAGIYSLMVYYNKQLHVYKLIKE